MLHNLLAQYRCQLPRFSPSGLLRFHAAGLPLGWVSPETADWLQRFDRRFVPSATQIEVPVSIGLRQLQALMRASAEAMRDEGLISGWRNEEYHCCAPDERGWPDADQALFRLERAAFRRFGLTSRAVHINGYTHSGALWVGRRAPGKAIDPDRLDNLAAGGLPAGETLTDCAIRELGEEAGLPPQLAGQLVACGAVRSTRNEPDGTHDEILYCYDLLLPDDFIPENRDGEVAAFSLLPGAEAATRLHEFTCDAGWVTADFLLRHHDE
ncbi:NUDIX hydrolase [Chitinilyticum piscinae]|uniref:DUF4743 domain-containing protein n=1 Tax=Chitinilyticum piscinae TaxID=2866724 RepID=A0A8J7K0G3_9NEIS|nr:DUF4743 domain-containing protein [Chitinilyticum piscinae]MBE9607976.1 DUF4743 domain-containing protein [Chitinilyticum piscinae]